MEQPQAQATDSASQATTHVVLVDFGRTGVSHDSLVKCAAALQRQMREHCARPEPYGLGFGHGFVVRAAASPLDVFLHEWVVGLFESPDVAGALGYHDRTPQGQPLAKVFPLLDAQDGVSWTSTASHELIEMSDAECTRARQSVDGRFWADEPADAVEADTYAIDGVEVSNFVLPAWYGGLDGLPYDHMRLCLAPLEVRPGGYAQWYDPQAGWQQVENFQKPPRAYRLQNAGRRRRRRLKP